MAKYRVGVIGCRGIGVRHTSGLVELPNAELAAACDILDTTLADFKEQWKDHWSDIALYTDHQEMLAKENLDIVTVATSDHRHADLVVNAANAGAKGIFCEKPMATNLADADRMLEAVERNGTILSIDHTRRWQPLWRHTKEEIVGAGEIGEVKYIIGTLNGGRAMLFRNGTHLVDADRMLEAVERNGTILSIDHTRRWQPLWRHTKEEIVGAGEIGEVKYIIGTLNGGRAMLFRNGTHLIDAICYYADSDPEWVIAELEAGYEDYWEYRGDGGHEPKTEPAASGYIHFANGVRGYYAGGSKDTPAPSFRLEIVGTAGYVLIDNEKASLEKDGTSQPITPPTWEVEGIPAGVQELVRVVAEGGESSSSGRDGHKVVEIMIGFLESQRRDNGKVTIPGPR